MAKVWQVKNGHVEKFEEGIGRRGLAVLHLDRAGDDLPVRLRQAAVGHRAVNDLVVALAGLQHHPPGKKEWRGGGINRRAAQRAHTLRTMHAEIARGVHIQPHIPIIGVEEHIIGSASHLQVAVRVQLRGGLIIDNLVGMQNVVAIVDHHPAGQGPGVSHASLSLGLPFHRHAAWRYWLRLGYGKNLLAGVVREGG